MGLYREVHTVPAGIAFHIRNGYLGLSQGTAAPDARRNAVLIGDILTDPVVQFRLQIASFLPCPDVFPLNDLQIMGEAANYKSIGQLGAKLLISLCLFAFRCIGEDLGLLDGVCREEGCVVASLPHRQGDETLFRQFIFPTFRYEDLRGDLCLKSAHGFILVDRQIFDGPSPLGADYIGAPAVLGKAVADP